MLSYLVVDRIAYERFNQLSECLSGSIGLKIYGYQAYIVEQWACERRVTSLVVAYTGNPAHCLTANVLRVPERTDQWSPVLIDYFKQMVQMHLLPKDTPEGQIFVTNLSSFPSNWTLVELPGEFASVWPSFVVNVNLRRLACVGRVAVSINEPSDSVVSKFRNMYKLSSSVPVKYAAKELVVLLQIGLYYFGVLDAAYVDGLLCNYTQKAMEKWWFNVGQLRFGVHPQQNENAYYSMTIAALFGLIISCRHRISSLKLRTPKDPFDADNFVQSIRRFQKAERLAKTNILDEPTLLRLFTVTNKSAGPTEIFNLMRSTMREGSSTKALAGLNTIESTQLDVLVTHLKGGRCLYLWTGKGSPLKHKLVHSDLEKSPITGIPVKSLIEDTDRQTRLLIKPIATKNSHNSLVSQFRKWNSNEDEPNLKISDLGTESGNLDQTSSLDPLASIGLHSKPISLSGTSTALHLTHSGQSSSRTHRHAPSIYSSRSGTSYISSNSLEGSTSSRSPRKPPGKVRLAPLVTETQILTSDDIGISSMQLHRPVLRRTQSSSGVEKVCFGFKEFESMPRQIRLYEKIRRLKQMIEERESVANVICDKLHEEIEEQDVHLMVEEQKRAEMKYQIHISSTKEHSVMLQIHQIDALIAKLEYEWQTLEKRMYDLDAAVSQFGQKIEAIENEWELCSNIRTTSSSFFSWLMNLLH